MAKNHSKNINSPQEKDPVHAKNQTLKLFAALNLFFSYLFLIDPRMALKVNILVNGLLLIHFHELGRSKKSGFEGYTMFAPNVIEDKQTSLLNAAVNNIIEGVASTYEGIINFDLDTATLRNYDR